MITFSMLDAFCSRRFKIVIGTLGIHMEEKMRFAFSAKIIFMVSVFICGCSEQSGERTSFNDLVDTAWNDCLGLPKDIIDDSKDTFFERDNQILLGLAGGASIAMHQGADDNLAGYFEKHEVFHSATDRGLKLFGGPGIHFAGASIWYALSVNSGDDFNKERAWTMIRALSLTSLTTTGLKAIRNNETPAGNKWGWPSGHTSSSFAVASVLDEFYGPKVGIPAYAAASLVALRMMDQKDHWGSDVVFGATLGWVVGHTVAGKHKQLEVAGFKVMPYVVSPRGAITGVTLVRQF
jgi:membrane-associated phospholipid phosphatase